MAAGKVKREQPQPNGIRPVCYSEQMPWRPLGRMDDEELAAIYEYLTHLPGSAVLAVGASRVETVAPLFAALLSIPYGDRYPLLTLSPMQQRRQTLAGLLNQFAGLASQKPILLLVEDAHWADATSLELLDLTVERVRQLPVLALFTFRPEFEPPWVGLPNVGTLTLGRLGRDGVESMVARVTGGRGPPAGGM